MVLRKLGWITRNDRGGFQSGESPLVTADDMHWCRPCGARREVLPLVWRRMIRWVWIAMRVWCGHRGIIKKMRRWIFGLVGGVIGDGDAGGA